MSAREVFENVVRKLPAFDRLRLASLILADLTNTEAGGLDMPSNLNDDDALDDLSAFAIRPAPPGTPAEENNP
jgi:hypothetical protein